MEISKTSSPRCSKQPAEASCPAVASSLRLTSSGSTLATGEWRDGPCVAAGLLTPGSVTTARYAFAARRGLQTDVQAVDVGGLSKTNLQTIINVVMVL